MSIKIVVDSKGLYQVPSSDNRVQIDLGNSVEPLSPLSPPVVGVVDETVVLGASTYVLVEPDSGPVTASLPSISPNNVGRLFVVMNSNDTENLVVSGTNDISGNGWEYEVTSAFGTVSLMPVSSSQNGFYWHIVSEV